MSCEQWFCCPQYLEVRDVYRQIVERIKRREESGARQHVHSYEAITLNPPGIFVRDSGGKLFFCRVCCSTTNAPRVLRVEVFVILSSLGTKQSLLNLGLQRFHGGDELLGGLFVVVGSCGLAVAAVRDWKRRVLLEIIARATWDIDL